MKLDPRNIRHLSTEDWRVLAAVEQGSRNHEVVPTPMIASISHLPSKSGVHRNISTLAKLNLISRVRNASYDGYRLTYGGLDYLALHAHVKSDSIFSVGNRIGVGKEADIVIVASPAPASRQLVLKIHRLGRISFRTVKTNRDYLRNRSTGNWMYLSRLAAMKEYAVLSALYDTNFPVPQPVTSNRHTVLMSLVEGTPLRSVSEVPDPASLYGQLIELILRLASYGLIHGDFNEFNILIEEIPTKPTKDDSEPGITLRPIIIDFPQTVSTTHMNAKSYFDRDVTCIKRFFQRRFGFTSDEPGPFFEDALKNQNARRLDVEVEASGFSRKMAAELQKYIEATEGERNEEDIGDSDDYSEGKDEVDEEQSDPETPPRIEGNDANADTVEIQEPVEIQEGLEKLTLAREIDDTASIAASTRSRRFVNPVKASRGWAI